MTLRTEHADLEAFLTGEPDYDADPIAARDDRDACTKLRILARIRREIEDVGLIHEAERVRLDDWRDARLDALRHQEAWAESSLELFHQAILRDDPKATIVDLPGGKLTVRKQQPAWEFGPEFVAWAMANAPGLVRIPDPVPAPDKAAAKKALQPTGESGEDVPCITGEGELVPGVTVTYRPAKHEVKLT